MKSPLQKIDYPLVQDFGLQWYVKRDDQYAPQSGHPFQGNKVRKLSGLENQLTQGSKLITFGGAFSNHLAAMAAFGNRMGVKTVGIVRGEAVQNSVLTYCKNQGMELHFVSRAVYRLKSETAERVRYQKIFGPGLMINEGGSGLHAFSGTGAILPEITAALGYEPDYFQLAAGTGGTAAGVIQASQHQIQPTAIEVFPVLKGNWMQSEIENQLVGHQARFSTGHAPNWKVISDYHFGGYAKQTAELHAFIAQFSNTTGIPLEPIYTGKLFYAVLDRISRGHYAPGSTLVTYHSGGIIAWPT